MRDKQHEEKVITFFMKGNKANAGQRLRPGRKCKKEKNSHGETANTSVPATCGTSYTPAL